MTVLVTNSRAYFMRRASVEHGFALEETSAAGPRRSRSEPPLGTQEAGRAHPGTSAALRRERTR